PFAKAYLQLFDEHFNYALGFGGDVLRRVIQAMSTKRSGVESNNALIQRLFLDATQKRADIGKTIDAFYEHCYPQLAHLVTPVVGAHWWILQLREMGYALVSATNPTYP